MKNVYLETNFYQSNKHNALFQVLRQFAFILILIRCGVNVEPEALRQSLGIFTSLGLLSTTAEAAAICLAAHFLFHIPVVVAILFG
jgi:NhaP-type Na+/H+ or K+/H+ antiporter